MKAVSIVAGGYAKDQQIASGSMRLQRFKLKGRQGISMSCAVFGGVDKAISILIKSFPREGRELDEASQELRVLCCQRVSPFAKIQFIIGSSRSRSGLVLTDLSNGVSIVPNSYY